MELGKLPMLPETLQSTSRELADVYRPIREDLALSERVFDDELASAIAFVNELCVYVRCYRGKMLRPAMLLLSARAAGESRPAHRTLAAVVEMVHMATLVHDDVLDGADERRKQPTIQSMSGNVTAVLLGDYLISHAFHLCSDLDSQYASRRIGAATNCVCEGELMQNRHRGNLELTESEYLEIIRRKTGALTAVACELGAHFGGADDETVQALHAYGSSAGIAFQIMDDVLDVIGDERMMGKSLHLDLSLGKLTLPVIHCVGCGDAATAAEIRALYREPAANRRRLRGLLQRTDSIDYAVSVARQYVDQSVARLNILSASSAKDSLVRLAEFIVQRQT